MEQHQIVARRRVADLDVIELQILTCVVRGMSARESAALIDVSLEEFARIRESMMQRLNAQKNADAVRIGLYAGLDLVAD